MTHFICNDATTSLAAHHEAIGDFDVKATRWEDIDDNHQHILKIDILDKYLKRFNDYNKNFYGEELNLSFNETLNKLKDLHAYYDIINLTYIFSKRATWKWSK